MAKTRGRVRRIETDTGKDFASFQAHSCCTCVAGRKPGKCLLDRGIDESLIDFHVLPNVTMTA